MRSRILGTCLSIIGMVILHAQQPDSVAVKRKVFTYEEYKQKQSIKDSLKTDSLKVETTTVTHTVIPILEVEDGSGLKEYPEVDEFDEKLLEELYNNDLYDYMYDDFVNLDDAAIVKQVVPTDTLKARLKRINATTPFNIEYNPILEKLINKKLSYRRVYLERLMTLSDYYFPMFEEQLDQYDIPLEMKYLAVVESALDAKAKSRVGATGMWQFMFATGRNYGLEVNSYVDERMDPEKATVAACKFLRSLYNIYGDWDLALAAYNSGPGNVNKAIRRSGGYRNYWNLRPYLPRETAGYVPAFQAMLYLFTYASEHGFKPLQNEHRSIVTDSIQVKKMIALEHVAQFTDQDIEVVQFHNPSYKLDLIPVVEGRKYYLRLPLKAMSKFVSNEDSVYAFAKAEFDKREKPLPELLKAESRVVYRVKSGDYLGKIANKYGVSVSKLKRWNNLRSSKLRIGQKIYIHPRRPVATIPVSQNNTSTTHKVKSGDSLWTIARKYGTSVRNLKKLNPDKTENLKPGMVLKLK